MTVASGSRFSISSSDSAAPMAVPRLLGCTKIFAMDVPAKADFHQRRC